MSGGRLGVVGFYEIYLDDQLIFREEGDWGRKHTHKVCTLPQPEIEFDEVPIEIDIDSNVEIVSNEVQLLSDTETNSEIVVSD